MEPLGDKLRSNKYNDRKDNIKEYSEMVLYI